MRSLLFVILLLGGLEALADVADTVRCREIGFSVSAERRDAELFASFIDPDARFVSQTVSRGPEAIAAAWAGFLSADGPSIKWRPQIIEVLEDGTLALSRGPYRVVTTDESGNESELWGTFNSVWRLQPDGEWKVVFDAGNASATPPAEATRQLLDQEDSCGDS
jgi:ketosteroid isomerase-like protein